MSQILMKTERDLGAMISFEPQDKDKKIYPLKIDAGFFNGQGLTGPEEFDSFKDFISRVSYRRTEVLSKLYLSGGISYLNGGFRNGSKYFYRTQQNNTGDYVCSADSSGSNIGKRSPRIYYGADAQVMYDNRFGRTELRAEFIAGTQSSTYITSATPGIPPVTLKVTPDYVFIGNFHGAYFYLLHTVKAKHQFFIKYDWYDPNARIKAKEITDENNFGPADIRYDTFGAGYIFYMNENLKLVVYYDHPVNEKTGIAGYQKNRRDDTYTIRIQYRF